ncbi:MULTISPECIES: type II toxin-antitoxin system VapC family toxin [unclassified Anabaena]|uniref:type II toxin-antitoxin system VapC family toxin n=1 Tax=unclassified Anabaena TaxID=2619674 RepID=UPI0014473312|nr:MULTISPECIES: PIN domain-containing protein [unclassified Anabaena]MTJ07239.1 type II toxin-antitoxin system VapC family toxin [Anabaena sp. UHCC 0204]MTJ55211.1 type II toxin-antitoxin system VapC family toxin [Anabaena sp. UHCC 0253]
MSNNRYFLDTSFIIALINQRDQYHQIANDLANYYDDSFLVTSDAIILEIANGLSRNYKQEATQLIEYLLNAETVEIIHVTPELFHQGFDLYKKFQDKEWGLVDCISFVIMRNQNITHALSFDHHFQQAGFSLVK